MGIVEAIICGVIIIGFTAYSFYMMFKSTDEDVIEMPRRFSALRANADEDFHHRMGHPTRSPLRELSRTSRRLRH